MSASLERRVGQCGLGGVVHAPFTMAAEAGGPQTPWIVPNRGWLPVPQNVSLVARPQGRRRRREGPELVWPVLLACWLLGRVVSWWTAFRGAVVRTRMARHANGAGSPRRRAEGRGSSAPSSTLFDARSSRDEERQTQGDDDTLTTRLSGVQAADGGRMAEWSSHFCCPSKGSLEFDQRQGPNARI